MAGEYSIRQTPAPHCRCGNRSLFRPCHSLYGFHFYNDIDCWELYDLENDPHELRNLFGDPAYAGEQNALFEELGRLQREYGDSLAMRYNASFGRQ